MAKKKTKKVTKKKTKRTSLRKYIAHLSNGMDRRDDETFEVWAKSYAEADQKAYAADWDKMRFSFHGVRLASECR